MRFLLFLISFPCLSRLWGHITKIKHPAFIVKSVIKFYASHYKIDMKRYEGNIEDYSSLSDFFIRRLDINDSPLEKDETSFLSPCDGTVTVIEKIFEDSATQVKGKSYSVNELVCEHLDYSKGITMMTIYLSPANYHRYHFPLDVHVEKYTRTGKSLYPVNKLSVGHIDQLFVVNERVSVKMNYKENSFYYVAVGASFVGSIKMEFADNITWNKPVKVDKTFNQLDETGRFEMGSTIVLAIPSELIGHIEVNPGDKVSTGQKLFGLN